MKDLEATSHLGSYQQLTYLGLYPAHLDPSGCYWSSPCPTPYLSCSNRAAIQASASHSSRCHLGRSDYDRGVKHYHSGRSARPTYSGPNTTGCRRILGSCHHLRLTLATHESAGQSWGSCLVTMDWHLCLSRSMLSVCAASRGLQSLSHYLRRAHHSRHCQAYCHLGSLTLPALSEALASRPAGS